MSENPSDGQGSIYYDANEHSKLIPSSLPLSSPTTSVGEQRAATGVEHSHSAMTIPSIAEEESPWADTTSNASAGGKSNSILPPSAHGYLSYGLHSAGTPSLPLSETETITVRDDESIGTLDGSYAGHLRAQSSLAKKWFNDIDIEPYMRLPGSFGKGGASGSGSGVGRGRRGGEFTGSRKTYFREPLLEELLPTSRKETLFPAVHGPVLSKDSMAAYIFGVMFTLMMIIGTLLCFIYPSELRDNIIRSSSMFRAFVDSFWILATAISVGSVVSLAWIILSSWFTNEMVHLMIYFAPMSAFIAGLWAALEFLHSHPGGGFWLLLGAVAGLSTSALCVTFLVTKRRAIQQTVEIIRLSSEVLSHNPGILVASLALLVVYAIFITIWLLFFVHILMLGYIDKQSNLWQLNSLSYYLQAFFVFMLMWTSMILSYVQKCTIGGVVGRWYFFRTENIDTTPQLSNSAWVSLKLSFTRFFGQICLASLVLTFVRLVRGIIQFYKFIASKLDNGIFSGTIKSISLFFGFIERLFEHVTDLAIYVAVLTGEGFWASGRSVFKVFRRNMLVGFTTDMIAQIIFMVSTTVAAALTGLSSYIFIAHVLRSPYGFSGAMIFSIMTWYVLRFFTSIFSDTMDASFVCFAIDLDTEKLHSQRVHQAFSHRVATGVEP